MTTLNCKHKCDGLLFIIPFYCRFHSIPGSKSDIVRNVTIFMHARIKEKVELQERNNIVLTFSYMQSCTY